MTMPRDTSRKKARALGLCSGGLDSILAGKVLQADGVEVEWVAFETPFFPATKAISASRMTGIPLTVTDITDIYLEMLRNPRCGFGRNMNPCLDCHTLMFRLAGDMMRERGFDFLFSGEVLGQRPMSQTKNSLRYVEKNSGYEGYIVRPLSIQHLPETLVEKMGLVRRETLYGITGRGRKNQMALAERFGITEYPAPAGGCLLTDRNYSHRLRDLFAHPAAHSVAETGLLASEELHLLRYGRHFRLSPTSKAVVGRDHRDNKAMLRHYHPDRHILVRARTAKGPVILVTGIAGPDEVALAAAICLGYGRTGPDRTAEVMVVSGRHRSTITARGAAPETTRELMI